MSDKREQGPQFPIASFDFPQAAWLDTETDPVAVALSNINGKVGAFDIAISDATNAITFTVTITNAKGGTIYTEAALARDTTHFKVAYSEKGTPDADFNAALVDGNLTATITPSGDPGSSGATVTVTEYHE